MLNYLDLEKFTNNSSNKNVKDSLVNSKTLRQIKTPVMKSGERYILDKNSRFFTDDIFYGLVIIKWIADKYMIDLPMVDELLKWSQNYLDEPQNTILNIECEYKYDPLKSGIPTRYETYSEIDLIS